MSWHQRAIETLAGDDDAIIYPRGGSMRPRIESGAKVTLEPCDVTEVKVNDAVFCKVNGRYYVHLVKSVDATQGRALIGNNRGSVNGWTTTVYGRVVKVETP